MIIKDRSIEIIHIEMQKERKVKKEHQEEQMQKQTKHLNI